MGTDADCAGSEPNGSAARRVPVLPCLLVLCGQREVTDCSVNESTGHTAAQTGARRCRCEKWGCVKGSF